MRTPRLLPLNMKGELTRAIYEGRKTLIRRVIDPCPAYYGLSDNPESNTYVNSPLGWSTLKDESKYQLGDYLWVRECFNAEDEYIEYKAEIHPDYHKDYKWQNPYCMRREQANLFLEITKIRVERLQKITNEDAIKEGILAKEKQYKEKDIIVFATDYKNYSTGKYDFKENNNGAINSFQTLWQSLKPKTGFSWDDNPWVWVYEFERCTKEQAYEACKIQLPK